MRQFLNVLYRRILYKIPLKLLLVILAVVSVFIACTQAMDLPTSTWRETGNYVYNGLFDYIRDTITFDGITVVNIASDIDFVCFKGNGTSSDAQYNLEYSINGGTWYHVRGQEIGCTDLKTIYFKGGQVNFFYFIDGDGYLKEQYTSLQCQTEYNLIPISSVDSNYCITNNLCPSNQCPVGSGGVSSLYINDILHVGSPFIYMTIPQEIGWDYTYTQGGTNMIIDVEGYNVDYDKIEGIVNTQSYTPDEYDLNSIITNVIPLFVPGLVIILFIYFIFRLIKKIF